MHLSDETILMKGSADGGNVITLNQTAARAFPAQYQRKFKAIPHKDCACIA